MAATYRVVPGSFSIAPAKSSYTTEEDVILNILCTTERKNGLGVWLVWSTDYKVYGEGGQLIASESTEHSMAPWTEIDHAEDDFSINLGKFSEGTLPLEASVSCHG